MGTPANLTNEARAKGVAAIKANAANDKANVQAKQLIDLLAVGGATLAEIATKLNASGYRTRRGCLFTPMAVKRLRTLK